MATRTSENNDNSGRLYSYDHQSPAYAATLAVTPDASETLLTPGQLTGAVTINLTVTSAQIGDKLILLTTSDSSSRTITLGTGFAVSATTIVGNADDQCSAVFIYDGTEFVEISRTITV